MKHYTLINHINNDVIFAGTYASYAQCLEDAVAQKTDLSYLDARHQNLSNATLDGAYMPSALLSGANLSGTNLSESNLSHAIFYNCALYNCCLSYSNLHHADLRGTHFGGTLIDGALLTQCTFSTLSCFDLDFQLCEKMEKSLFSSPDGAIYNMSKPPLVFKGFMNTPIIILDDGVKIGASIFPKAILPALLKMMLSYARTCATNDNGFSSFQHAAGMQSLKKTV